MYRFVTVFAAVVAVTLAAPEPISNVFKIDISPEEAQQYLNSPPFTEPQLSGRTAVLPLVRWNDPRFRTAEAGPTLGHYWKNGREIENTDDYVEEVYDASQFHGQDGLGAYAYGYKTPESAKVENRVHSGDVTGSYTYKAGGQDELIKVRYWADSQGFHQEDNLPKVVLEPAQETEEVRQARLAHEKAWQEAASAAAQQPDPQGNYSPNYQQQPAPAYQGFGRAQGFQASGSSPYPVSASAPGYQSSGQGFQSSAQSYQSSHGFQASASAPNPVSVAAPGFQSSPQGYQASASAPNPVSVPAPGQHSSSQGYQASASSSHSVSVPAPGYQASASEPQANLVQAPGQREGKQYSSAQAQSYQGSQQYSQSQQYGQGQQSQGKPEDPEPTGPPRGFFYSFDYPVSIIVGKNEAQGGSVNTGQPVDHDTVGLNARQG